MPRADEERRRTVQVSPPPGEGRFQALPLNQVGGGGCLPLSGTSVDPCVQIQVVPRT